MKRLSNKSIDQLFFSGNHEKVLELTVDSASGRFALTDLVSVVGALTFLGRIEEAELLVKKHDPKIANETRCACYFFLGIAFCRHSQYDRALSFLAANLLLARRSRDAGLHFYAYQGLGFYRFFCGRYANALSAGRKAFHAALVSEFNYGKFLASDLMGHAQIQTGQISSGLKMISESLRYSKYLGSGETDESVRITLACYQAQFGIDPSKDLALLQSLFETLSPQDTYSRSSLLLEIGRQLTLRGQLKASQEALNQACRLIYSSGHRRQGVTLNLRYAHNLVLSGDWPQALNLVRTTAKELDPLVDKALELQVLGLEHTLNAALGVASPNGCLEKKIKKWTLYSGAGTGRRMFKRKRGGDTFLVALGEDPLGDLIDLRDRALEEALPKILECGYLGLLNGKLPIPNGEAVLYFDVLPDTLLIVEKGDWQYQSRGISTTLKALTRVLAQGEASKQTLIEKVWGYRYDRLRHDSLIYPAISRLRQLLGSKAHWVEVTDRGYRLQVHVHVGFHRAPEIPRGIPQPISDQERGPEDSLNYRQLSVLRHLQKQTFMDVQAYKRLFKVSQITASRDLSELHRLALIERSGRGRATRYYTQKQFKQNLNRSTA